jgi:hypothetical protein
VTNSTLFKPIKNESFVFKSIKNESFVFLAVVPAPPQVNGKRGHVITELLSTEQNFLESLEIVRDVFVNPLRDAKLLDQSELETIFINWNELIVCSNRLCK